MKKVSILIFCIFLSTLIISSCKVERIELSGMIAMESNYAGGDRDNVVKIFSSKDTVDFILTNSPQGKYSGLSWFHTKDFFIANEYIKDRNQSNLVTIDTEGQILEKIFETEPGIQAGQPFLSPHDNKLVFSISNTNRKSKRVSDAFYIPVSIIIMDFQNKKIVKRMENFCFELNLGIEESPWSPDEKQIVYSISHDRSVTVKGESPRLDDTIKKSGVYIYDLEKDEHKLIIPNGTRPIWSPDGNFIAYRLNGSIWLYNTKDGSQKLFYRKGRYEWMGTMHWTPDSKYFYLACPKEYFNLYPLYSYNEKLIRVKGRKSVRFKKIFIDRRSYTWK